MYNGCNFIVYIIIYYMYCFYEDQVYVCFVDVWFLSFILVIIWDDLIDILVKGLDVEDYEML